MGRTLHYGVQGKFAPTDEQELALHNLADHYNNKFNWTCESVGLSALDFYPNWSYFNQGVTDAWTRVDLLYDAMIDAGKTRVEAIREMQIQ